MSGKHDRGKRKHGFCAVPANPKCGDCPEPETYIEVCKPDGWFEHTFKRIKRARTRTVNFDKKYEAHHLVCVSPCSVELVAKKAIAGVVAQTVWCINNGKNMLAMPLWGHTVMWYCEITAGGGAIDDQAIAPRFANIPQHDWDHNCKEGYTWEVAQACKTLAKEIEEAGHELEGEDLRAALDALSEEFRGKLLARGARCGGTHAAWQKGLDDPDSDWCHPFSMASDSKLTRKGFPVRKFDDQVAAWIKRIAEAIAVGE